MESQLGLRVLDITHGNYKRIPWHGFTCGTHCQGNRHTIEQMINALQAVEGSFVAEPSFFRDHKFEGGLYLKGMRLVKAAFWSNTSDV